MNPLWLIIWAATSGLLILSIADKKTDQVKRVKESMCLQVDLGNQRKRAADTGMICECAAFTTKKPLKTDTPILAHTTINVTCSKQDERKCADLCIALGKASKEQGPSLLCATLGYYKNLLAALFSTSCGENKWIYTNVTAQDPICCHNNKTVNCTTLTE